MSQQRGFDDDIPFLVGAGLTNASKVVCYMNAGLQALFHVGVFVRWLVRNSPHANRCSRRCKTVVTCMLLQLLKGVRDSIVCDAQPLLELFGESSLLDAGEQNDVHEFFQELYRQLNGELGIDSPWQGMFGIELIQRVECAQCGFVAMTSRIETELQLTITAKSKVGVVDLVKEFFSVETIPDGLNCKRCADIVTIRKSVAIAKPPVAIILQLVRFKFTNKTATKTTRAVHVPDTLNLAEFGGNDKLYELKAVVNHDGSLKKGHYTTVVPSIDGQFVEFNDEAVTNVEEIDSKRCYILMYEQVTTCDETEDVDSTHGKLSQCTYQI